MPAHSRVHRGVLGVSGLNRERCYVFPNKYSNKTTTKLQQLLYSESEQTLHYHMVLDIHSTKSSFNMFNFTVVINTRMNIKGDFIGLACPIKCALHKKRFLDRVFY